MRSSNRVWLALAGFLFVVGCGAKTVVVRDTTVGTETEMPETEYRAQSHESFLLSFQTGIAAWLMDCGAPNDRNVSEGERRDCIHNNQLVLVQVPYMLQAAQNVNAGYWQVAAQRERRPLDIINTIFNGVTAAGSAGLLPWGPNRGSSSGNEFSFKARDNASIEVKGLTAGNKSPLIRGDDNMAGVGKTALAKDSGMAATNDGQNLSGQGNSQAQVQTDPIPGTNFGDATAGDEGTGSPQVFQPESGTGLEILP